MKEIKDFIDSFLSYEAIAYFKRLKPDLDAFNKAYDAMNACTVGALSGQMGLIRIDKLDPDDFYERYTNITPFNPRHLYKISHYKHKVFNNVWIAYTSTTNPRPAVKTLSYALFVIQEDGAFKIARDYVYSTNHGMNATKDWVGLQGLQALTFESLGALVAIERYLEPLEYGNSLNLYLEER